MRLVFLRKKRKDQGKYRSLEHTTNCFRAPPIRLRTYYSGNKYLILLCVPKQLLDNEEGIENRDESRDFISIFDAGRKARREQKTTKESEMKSTLLLGGQEEGLEAKEDKDSKLTDGKIHGNDDCTG